MIWLSGLTLCVLLVLGLYGRQTLALLGAQTQTANTGYTGKVAAEVYSVTTGKSQMDIGVINTGTTDCYVRMMVAVPGESVTGSQTGNLLEVEGINLMSWTKGDDGYYYYNDILPPGKTTNYLYRLIQYHGIPADTSLDQLSIITYAEAVQSAYLDAESTSGGLTAAQNAFQQVRK